MQRFSTMICFAALTVVMGATAQAATLEIIQAPVSANFGQGFVPIDTGTQLNPGVQVMAKPGGRGQIVYDNGCTEPVEEGKVVVVQEDPSCVGAGLPFGDTHHVLLGTAVAAGVGVGIYYLIKDDDDDKASSP